VEIKGVAHTSWMPELTHNEAFRQYALLHLRNELNQRISDPASWKMSYREIGKSEFKFKSLQLPFGGEQNIRAYIVNLPGFKGMLSHFTQPGKMFADEISGRLKVVACIELPNMVHSEMFEDTVGNEKWEKFRSKMKSREDDAQLIFWGPEEDIKTGLETIEERCLMAFKGIPNETRKSFEDGTTIFERVLPGADRMYPDTDTAPIPLEDSYIEELSKRLPVLVSGRIDQLMKWNIPTDAFTYILKNNLVPLIEKVQNDLKISPKFTGILLAHTLKNLSGKYPLLPGFTFEHVYGLLKFIRENNLELSIAKRMLVHLYQHPKMDFESILITTGFRHIRQEEIVGKIPFLVKKYQETRTSKDEGAGRRWIMGNLHKSALGNISLAELSGMIKF
jgi:glutamyl-tRNA(Gln) amidotransferase subunit E